MPPSRSKEPLKIGGNRFAKFVQLHQHCLSAIVRTKSIPELRQGHFIHTDSGERPRRPEIRRSFCTQSNPLPRGTAPPRPIRRRRVTTRPLRHPSTPHGSDRP